MADHNNWCIDIICSLTLKYSILSAHAVNTVACIICVPIGTIDIISSISIRLCLRSQHWHLNCHLLIG